MSVRNDLPCSPSLTAADAGRIAIPGPRRWREWLGTAWRAWRWMLVRRRTRRALVMLDDRLLRDVGLTRNEARREADKPMWWP